MPTKRNYIIGSGKNSRPTYEQVVLLSKLGIDPSDITYTTQNDAGEDGYFCNLALPDDGTFADAGGTSKFSPKTTIRYKGTPVMSIERGLKFKVWEEGINYLAENELLPPQSDSMKRKVEEYGKMLKQEKQYESLEKQLSKFCSEYTERLQRALEQYKVGKDGAYKKPPDTDPLGQLAFKKREIITEAKKILDENRPSSAEKLDKCLKYLQSNRDTLKQNRDSTWMAGAKSFFTLGIGIKLWRAFWGDDVTKGMGKVSLFSKKYDKLQPSETNELKSDDKKSSHQ